MPLLEYAVALGIAILVVERLFGWTYVCCVSHVSHCTAMEPYSAVDMENDLKKAKEKEKNDKEEELVDARKA